MPPFKVSPEPPCPGLRRNIGRSGWNTGHEGRRTRRSRHMAGRGGVRGVRGKTRGGWIRADAPDQAVAQVLHSAHGSAFRAAPAGAMGHGTRSRTGRRLRLGPRERRREHARYAGRTSPSHARCHSRPVRLER